jgi:hypothetical protein
MPDGSVQLRGQVVRPTTKTDAERRVRDIEGITRVDDQIEVLPVSPNDDRLRIAIYRALFNFDSPLFTRYGTRAVPPIHIIVKTGARRSKALSQISWTTSLHIRLRDKCRDCSMSQTSFAWRVRGAGKH